MKTGMNLLLWTTNVNEDSFKLISDLGEIGFDGVEIPIGEGNEAQYSSVRNELDRLGMGCTTVTSLDPETNPISPDHGIRDAALERLKWAINMTAAAGGEVMCGPFHSAFKTFAGRGPTEDEKKWGASVLREAAEYAAKKDVLLCVEFINRFECYFLNTVADAKAFVHMVDHPNMKILYDTHHSHIEEKNISDALRSCASVLGHFHIAENDRGTPGKGQVNWEETFKMLKEIDYDSWMVIEAFSADVPDFAAGINVWRNYASSRDELARDGLQFIKKMWSSA
jgi:D-psicose/D-tagatose/L-ribulose 3-epimerase